MKTQKTLKVKMVKMIKVMAKISGIILIFLFSLANRTFCCDCGDHNPIVNHNDIRKADAIFLAEIDSVYSLEDDNYLIDIEINELFKGGYITKVKVFGYNTSCDLFFKKGQKWVLFSTIIQGINTIEICSSSFMMSNDTNEIDKININFLRNFNQIEDNFVYSEVDINPNYEVLSKKVDSISKRVYGDKENIIGKVYFKATLLKSGEVTDVRVVRNNLKGINDLNDLINGLLLINGIEPAYIDNKKVNSEIFFVVDVRRHSSSSPEE